MGEILHSCGFFLVNFRRSLNLSLTIVGGIILVERRISNYFFSTFVLFQCGADIVTADKIFLYSDMG